MNSILGLKRNVTPMILYLKTLVVKCQHPQQYKRWFTTFGSDSVYCGIARIK